MDGTYYPDPDGTAVEIPGGQANTVFWTRTADYEVPEADKALGHAPLKPMGYAGPFTAEYHAHMNPVYLRAQLGDNVVWVSKEGHYEELGSHHSPILGWANDGFPVYGPYGYTDPGTPGNIRRMRSGFTLRDGSNGTTDLTLTGRKTLAKWMVGFHSPNGLAYDGPDVTELTLGYCVEDYSYLGDLGKTQGTDFDLDKYNGRYCVTPEYPNGIYAYFLTIDDFGVPVFPYVVCREYYGVATGMKVPAASEPVTVYAYGALSQPITSNTILLWWWGGVFAKSVVWNSVEGFYYEIEGFRGGGWVTYEFTETRASGTTTRYRFGTDSPPWDCTSYRVKAVGYDPYDSVY
jgi:YHYH protein